MLKVLGTICNFSVTFCPILFAVIGYCHTVSIDMTEAHPFLITGIDFFKKHIAFILILNAIVLCIALFLKKILIKPNIVFIKWVIDKFRDQLFCDFNDPKDHHRVTLFKLTKWTTKPKWDRKNILDIISFDKYLVPTLRSGEQSKKTFSKFRICDTSDDSKGVGGFAYTSNKVVVIDDLGEMNEQATPEFKKNYAKKTYSDESMIEYYIKKNRKMPRSIAAFPLEVRGKVWGVLVIDSRLPSGITKKHVNHYMTLIVHSISHLLEEKL